VGASLEYDHICGSMATERLKTSYLYIVHKNKNLKMVYLSFSHRNSQPLFFLWVRTNVSYAAVGVFVTQTMTKEVIAEALKVFQKWNSDWNPSHFMVGFCEVEIGALEEVFKGTFGCLDVLKKTKTISS